MSQLVINILDKALKSKGQSLKKTNEYMWWSPFVQHHKPKLQVNIQTGKWHCWVSNQGGHNHFQLLKALGADRSLFKEMSDAVGSTYYTSEKKDDKQIILNLPKEAKPLWNGGDSLQKLHALKFVMERGLSMEDIIRYNLHYCLSGIYQNRILIPSYDSNGQLNYFVGRDFYRSTMKYKNPPVPKDVIGFDLYVNWDEPIVLCEGVFDAIAIRRNAIPLFGKTVPKKLKRKIYEKNVTSIYILLDRDAIKDSIKIIDDFMNNGIDVYFVNLTDEDPSDMGFESTINLIKKTKQTSFSDLMRMRLNGKQRKYMEI